MYFLQFIYLFCVSYCIVKNIYRIEMFDKDSFQNVLEMASTIRRGAQRG